MAPPLCAVENSTCATVPKAIAIGHPIGASGCRIAVPLAFGTGGFKDGSGGFTDGL